MWRGRGEGVGSTNLFTEISQSVEVGESDQNDDPDTETVRIGLRLERP